jgi:hypothetical protein
MPIYFATLGKNGKKALKWSIGNSPFALKKIKMAKNNINAGI